MPDRQNLLEAQGTVTLSEGSESGIADVTLITPGRGSSGVYSAQVLEAAATDGVFPAGTHMYLDHPAPGERPERSLDRLAGVLTEAATWNGTALTAPARIYPRFRQMLTDMQDAIGVSIRAGGVIESGVVTSIGPVASVDFVTKPGRGGSFALVEAATPLIEGHGMTANDLSQALSDAIRDAHGGDGIWTYVRDYTDEWVVFTVESSDDSDLLRDTYSVTAGVVTLAGAPVEVRAVTTYEVAAPDAEDLAGEPPSPGGVTESTPVFDATRGANPPTPTVPVGQPASDPLPVPNEESQEDPMPELTEAEQAAITRAETAERERDAARAELAASRRRDAARPIVTTALAEAALAPRTIARLTEALVEGAPALENGDLDEAALTTAVNAARVDAEAEAAELLAESGIGQVRGLGGGAPLTESDKPSAEYAAIYGTEA